MTVISRELYEAAGDAWLAARDRYDEAHQEAQEAEKALYAAEAALAAQEASPGIAAYMHARVPADQCRIGSHCKVHHGEGDVPW